ncbi:hypothetical protein GCM10017776_33440 [Streptomyces griseoluteus]|nr:hypothetical protein GCM10017776_33440 [Streptomyces griseoluteus]
MGVHLARAHLGREGLVDGQRGGAGGHPEQGVGLAAKQLGHGFGYQLAARRGVRDDDNFHAGPADLEEGRRSLGTGGALAVWFRPI